MKSREDCTCHCHKSPPESVFHVTACCIPNNWFAKEINEITENFKKGIIQPLSDELFELAEQAIIASKETAGLDPEEWARQLIDSMKDENGRLPND